MTFHIEEIKLSDWELQSWLATEGTVFLDTASAVNSAEGVSILGIDPIYTFSTSLEGVLVRSSLTKTEFYEQGSVFSVVDSYVRSSNERPLENVGFSGGFLGLFSYESAACFSDFHFLKYPSMFPDVLGGIYDRYIILDHSNSTTFFVSIDLYGRECVKFETCGPFPAAWFGEPFKSHSCRSTIDYALYCKQIKQILEYIRQGDVYQVNFSHALEVDFTGDLVRLYWVLRDVVKAPYQAFVHMNDSVVLSSSPELFFSVSDGRICTHPIKGTMPRHHDKSIDLCNQQRLINSEKDKAELMMIVDLERHDLSKICKIGTVNVTNLRDVCSFQYVFHALASIEGELKSCVNFESIMEAMFPGGSITGAPKIRSMEIISELERRPRGPYTGTIGFLSTTGDMCFNIAIRTLYEIQQKLYFHVGGGIVSDSSVESEWEETWVKARGIMQAIGA